MGTPYVSDISEGNTISVSSAIVLLNYNIPIQYNEEIKRHTSYFKMIIRNFLSGLGMQGPMPNI